MIRSDTAGLMTTRAVNSSLVWHDRDPGLAYYAGWHNQPPSWHSSGLTSLFCGDRNPEAALAAVWKEVAFIWIPSCFCNFTPWWHFCAHSLWTIITPLALGGLKEIKITRSYGLKTTYTPSPLCFFLFLSSWWNKGFERSGLVMGLDALHLHWLPTTSGVTCQKFHLCYLFPLGWKCVLCGI